MIVEQNRYNVGSIQARSARGAVRIIALKGRDRRLPARAVEASVTYKAACSPLGGRWPMAGGQEVLSSTHSTASSSAHGK